MMKILLTVPITSFVNDPPNIPDLGLAYIAASLKEKGHKVHVKDWNMDPSQENFKVWLKENRPEVIGIKIFTKDVRAAKKTISIIRKTLNGTIIVIGGPHPSAAQPSELMEDFADVDFAIRGEAEQSFPVLLSEFKDSSIKSGISAKQFQNIPGLVWREGTIVLSNPISFIHDLDSIDFPCWEMFDPKDYSVIMGSFTLKNGYTAPIITTRGCPGKCTFCSAYNVNGRKIRRRSPANVLSEISLLYNSYNVRKFSFQDNCFTSHKGNLIDICNGIIEAKMNIEWDFVSYERLDNLTDETLSLIYRAGGRMIHMGIESGSEKTRKVMNKSCFLNEISEKIKVIRRNGIKVGAWFMIGFPEETKEDMKETIRYGFSLDVDIITFTICFPLPGSQVYDYIKDKYKFKTIDWATFDIKNSIYPVSRLSSGELKRLRRHLMFRLLIKNALKKAMKKIVNT